MQTDTFGSSQEAGLPNIEGVVTALAHQKAGVFYLKNNVNGYTGGNGSKFTVCGFDASLANNIYGSSDTVMPNNVSYPIIIYLGK